MQSFNKNLGKSFWLVFGALGCALLSLPLLAQECPPLDKDTKIAAVLADHPNGKILKVEEQKDTNGCTELNVRVIVDGTVTVVVVKGG